MPSTDLDDAIACHKAGDLAGARSIYETLLESDRNQADVLNLLGVLNAQEGETEAAEALLEEATSVDPTHARAYGSLGNLRRMQERMDDAISAYEKARQFDPDNPTLQFNLAAAYDVLDRSEEAEAAYRRAIDLAPDHAQAHFGLGKLLDAKKRIDEAISAIADGLRFAPDNATMHEMLGSLYRRAGRLDLAADGFAMALEKDPKRTYLDHLVRSFRGETVDTASSDYVRYLFDGFAEDYEDLLTGVLGYRGPELLREMLETSVGTDVRFNHGLDLGCGTGLSGKAFHDVVTTLDGVDLSSRMLERARALDIYTNLAERDIESYLADSEDTFDLFLAADVFVYVGDLRPTFELMRARAADGAIVLFSTERGLGDDYTLEQTGRYRHSSSYLDTLTRETGFQLLQRTDATVRSEADEPVKGYLCLAVAV